MTVQFPGTTSQIDATLRLVDTEAALPLPNLRRPEPRMETFRIILDATAGRFSGPVPERLKQLRHLVYGYSGEKHDPEAVFVEAQGASHSWGV
ncbi:MAG: hypothetical protein MK180_01190 [Rhodobacteraceae bacterium]|nr:hypothetical protein [Paracoccaceae bacterium]